MIPLEINNMSPNGVFGNSFNIAKELETWCESSNPHGVSGDLELEFTSSLSSISLCILSFSSTTPRRKKNRVDTICNEDGLRFDGEDASGQFVKHFKCFIRTVAEVQSLCCMGDIFKCSHTIKEANEMIINVTNNEIKEAILDIDSNKALRLGKLLGEVNATIIALVLKLITPNKVSDFRPIACLNGSFKYHYGCKELKLTHMCFADDLLVMCNGDKESLKIIKKALEEFSDMSGLFHNLSKSKIFFGTLKEIEKQELLNIMPFKSGKLLLVPSCFVIFDLEPLSLSLT
ncbi:hypothetical protein Tco_1088139, partial [Tanacetum coccineum]